MTSTRLLQLATKYAMPLAAVTRFAELYADGLAGYLAAPLDTLNFGFYWDERERDQQGTYCVVHSFGARLEMI